MLKSYRKHTVLYKTKTRLVLKFENVFIFLLNISFTKACGVIVFTYWLILDLQKYKPNKGFYGNRKDGYPVESREFIRKFIWCFKSGISYDTCVFYTTIITNTGKHFNFCYL